MILSKRQFLTLTAALPLAPLMAQAADIKAMAEALVNLTIAPPDGDPVDYTLTRDEVAEAYALPPPQRPEFVLKVLAGRMSDQGGLPEGVAKTLHAKLMRGFEWFGEGDTPRELRLSFNHEGDAGKWTGAVLFRLGDAPKG